MKYLQALALCQKLPKFCRNSALIFIGKIKKMGKVKITQKVKTKPVIIKMTRAIKPKIREKIKKAIFSKISECSPASLSFFQGEKRVFNRSGIEKALKA